MAICAIIEREQGYRFVRGGGYVESRVPHARVGNTPQTVECGPDESLSLDLYDFLRKTC